MSSVTEYTAGTVALEGRTAPPEMKQVPQKPAPVIPVCFVNGCFYAMVELNSGFVFSTPGSSCALQSFQSFEQNCTQQAFGSLLAQGFGLFLSPLCRPSMGRANRHHYSNIILIAHAGTPH